MRFDDEYATSDFSEVDFLRSKEIRYEFVKKYEELKVFKYKKNVELFKVLMEFQQDKLK